jgi:hypothetical protein
MFHTKALTVFALVVMGLGACKATPPEDQIIDRKTYLMVETDCRGSGASCVLKVFERRTSEYCAKNELSAGHPKCIELQEKVKQKILDNSAQNLQDLLK